MARPYHGSIHPHKISDRYDSPNPFKNAVTELVSCQLARALAKHNSITSIFFNLQNRGKKCNKFDTSICVHTQRLPDLHISISEGRTLKIKFFSKNPTSHGTSMWAISQEIIVEWGQLSYLLKELILKHNLFIFVKQSFIFTDLAGLRSEKKANNRH